MKVVEQKNWVDQYKENYNGKSAEGKELEGYLKQTFNGKDYIPWATMERLTYMQDPNAVFTKIRNENGGLVHTDSFVNENCVENKDGIVNRTTAMVVSHFVKVSCVFLGKEFIEEYPIQDQDYSAAKIYNQNLVNRALQRALAKVASRATGLGLKLYENKDLQFDNVAEEKPVVKKETTKKTSTKTENTETQPIVEEVVEVVKVEPRVEPVVEIKQDAPVQVEQPQVANVVENASYSKDIIELCNLIKNTSTDKITPALQALNVAILKQHGFTLNQTDSESELCEKLTHFKDVSVFTRAITNMIK
jgi:hypothetical protein